MIVGNVVFLVVLSCLVYIDVVSVAGLDRQLLTVSKER